jgi:hypothetical protein
MKFIYHLCLLLACGATLVNLSQAQTQTTTPMQATPPQQKFEAPLRLPNDLVEFFSGVWNGAGEFASGKKIEAVVSFHPDLDGQWFAYRHTDRAPNKYKAFGMWGYEYTSKTLIMVLSDNFGGSRLFTSEGWLNGKVIFQRNISSMPKTSALPTQTRNLERFVFERQSSDRFKMIYETSNDGKEWRLVDYLIFTKEPGGSLL